MHRSRVRIHADGSAAWIAGIPPAAVASAQPRVHMRVGGPEAQATDGPRVEATFTMRIAEIDACIEGDYVARVALHDREHPRHDYVDLYPDPEARDPNTIRGSAVFTLPPPHPLASDAALSIALHSTRYEEQDVQDPMPMCYVGRVLVPLADPNALQFRDKPLVLPLDDASLDAGVDARERDPATAKATVSATISVYSGEFSDEPLFCEDWFADANAIASATEDSVAAIAHAMAHVGPSRSIPEGVALRPGPNMGLPAFTFDVVTSAPDYDASPWVDEDFWLGCLRMACLHRRATAYGRDEDVVALMDPSRDLLQEEMNRIQNATPRPHINEGREWRDNGRAFDWVVRGDAGTSADLNREGREQWRINEMVELMMTAIAHAGKYGRYATDGIVLPECNKKRFDIRAFFGYGRRGGNSPGGEFLANDYFGSWACGFCGDCEDLAKHLYACFRRFVALPGGSSGIRDANLRAIHAAVASHYTAFMALSTAWAGKVGNSETHMQPGSGTRDGISGHMMAYAVRRSLHRQGRHFVLEGTTLECPRVMANPNPDPFAVFLATAPAHLLYAARVGNSATMSYADTVNAGYDFHNGSGSMGNEELHSEGVTRTAVRSLTGGFGVLMQTLVEPEKAYAKGVVFDVVEEMEPRDISRGRSFMPMLPRDTPLRPARRTGPRALDPRDARDARVLAMVDAVNSVAGERRRRMTRLPWTRALEPAGYTEMKTRVEASEATARFGAGFMEREHVGNEKRKPASKGSGAFSLHYRESVLLEADGTLAALQDALQRNEHVIGVYAYREDVYVGLGGYCVVVDMAWASEGGDPAEWM